MDDLEKLRAQIADLTAKADKLAAEKRAPIIEDIKAKIALYSITAEEIGFLVTKAAPTTEEKAKKDKKPVAVKYQLTIKNGRDVVLNHCGM